MQQQDYLNELNESQREAVEYISGPSLVIAGAGSGKTRVLTYKIAHLLTNGLKPWEIMALTFTNKAAREMKERIGNIVGGDTARYLRMGTFHSLFARILRAEAAHIGYNNNYTIYDEADSRALLKSVIKELGLNDKVYKPADIHSRISSAKNRLITAEQYAADPYVISRDNADKVPQTAQIYAIYQQRCKASNAMDFDDLLLNTYLLFKEHDDILEVYANALRFILVDEYQDTNYAQQCIIMQLTSRHHFVCVVGDDAQSIYGFRGANIDNILNFQKIYTDARLFKLEQNYRSTKRIVQAANSLIHKNQWQIEKNVFSHNDEGDKLLLKEFASDREEAMYVCNDIKRRVRHEGLEYSDCAILYRTNYQSRTFEEQFMKNNVPYSIYGGMSFYQRKEIKDIIAYFRLVVNHDDEEAFRRIINYPTRGIGDTTVQKVAAAAHSVGMSMWQVICSPADAGLDVNKGTLTKLANFRALIEGFSARLATEDAFAIGQNIVKQSGITQEIYSSNEPEYRSRQENIEEFMSSMQEFVETAREEGEPDRLTDFLHDVALLSDRDTQDDTYPKVTLMTIHSSKGLEFPIVYIVGMEENIFPSPLCTDTQRKLEEERRLLYVAITRAEKSCTLTYARSRYRYGKMEFDTPSRFIRDIDPNFLTIDSSSANTFRQMTGNSRQSLFGSMPEYGQRTNYNTQRQSNLRSLNAAIKEAPHRVTTPPSPSPQRSTAGAGGNITVGTSVLHERFGKGIVRKIEGNGESTKATVEFENAGTKQLLLKFARLKVQA